ncbi:MAG: right-handed parallel beta-helix repeat-containing protein, partial [Candidatus Thorarchaeota archaeon]
RALFVSIGVLMLVLPIGNTGTLTSNETINFESTFTSSQYVEHDPILIESDEDFIEQGWPGSGTKYDPYLIEGYLISSIEIFNTRTHVLIRHCIFLGISASNVTNLIVEKCQFQQFFAMNLEGCEISNNIVDGRTGISIYESTDCYIFGNLCNPSEPPTTVNSGAISLQNSNRCTIERNTISGYRDAIHIVESKYSQVINNRIFRNRELGIFLGDSFHALIFNNTVYSNMREGISLVGSSNTTVHSNYLGGNRLNAWDGYGVSNQWDDGVSRGNFWDDYSVSEVYEIEGSTNSSDRFPSLWPLDLWGPEFHCPYFHNYIGIHIMLAEGTKWGHMDSYLISVNVTDPAGVDCVQLVKKASLSDEVPEWINYPMQHDPIPNNPDRYTYNVSFQEHGSRLNFYFIANDTLGNWNITRDYWLESKIIVRIPSTPVDELESITSNPFVFSGIFGGILALVALYLYKRPKTPRYYGPTIHIPED